jgi:hypothetical protein
MTETTITNEQSLEAYIVHLRASLKKHKVIKVIVKSSRQRTLTQNKALHKYFALLAQTLNDAGLDMQTVLKPGASIPWSEEKVKSDIWATVQLVMIGHSSTSKLKTHECSKVYDVVARHLSETFGIFIPFPSKDSYN